MRGYDRWKLATPPEYDLPSECPKCGEELDYKGCCPEPSGECAVCGIPEEEHATSDDACRGPYTPDHQGCGWPERDDDEDCWEQDDD